MLWLVALLAPCFMAASDAPPDTQPVLRADGVYDEVQHRSLLQAGLALSITPDMLPQAANFRHLDARIKFELAVKDSFDPVSTVITFGNAGFNTLDNSDRAFGNGWAGFGRRFGTYETDDFVSEFFQTFLIPSVLRQDPRYHRMTYAPVRVRLVHALTHVLISQTDNNRPCLNYGELLGTPAASIMSNIYHEGEVQGFQATARRDLISVGSDAAWDVFTEFIPDVVKHIKIRNLFLQRLEFEALK
jgi:hypothetical protein